MFSFFFPARRKGMYFFFFLLRLGKGLTSPLPGVAKNIALPLYARSAFLFLYSYAYRVLPLRPREVAQSLFFSFPPPPKNPELPWGSLSSSAADRLFLQSINPRSLFSPYEERPLNLFPRKGKIFLRNPSPPPADPVFPSSQLGVKAFKCRTPSLPPIFALGILPSFFSFEPYRPPIPLPLGLEFRYGGFRALPIMVTILRLSSPEDGGQCFPEESSRRFFSRPLNFPFPSGYIPFPLGPKTPTPHLAGCPAFLFPGLSFFGYFPAKLLSIAQDLFSLRTTPAARLPFFPAMITHGFRGLFFIPFQAWRSPSWHGEGFFSAVPQSLPCFYHDFSAPAISCHYRGRHFPFRYGTLSPSPPPICGRSLPPSIKIYHGGPLLLVVVVETIFWEIVDGLSFRESLTSRADRSVFLSFLPASG